MITTILSPIPSRRVKRRLAGFTLVEIMISASLAAFIMAGMLSTFLFLGRSGANIQNYTDMESQARSALERFAEDVRQASAITWTSNVQISLTVNSATIVYLYSSGTGLFSRVDASSNRTLLSGITPNSFSFQAYSVTGTELPLSSAANLTAAGANTKQLQISLKTSRKNQTVAAATNTVLSARFILRNKPVTV
jgi:Tfp pilus assembly protein PilW